MDYFDYKQFIIIWIHTPLVSSFETLKSTRSVQDRKKRKKSSQVLVFDSDDDEEELEKQRNEINLPSPLPIEGSDNDSNISEVFDNQPPPYAVEDLGYSSNSGRGEWTSIMLWFKYLLNLFPLIQWFTLVRLFLFYCLEKCHFQLHLLINLCIILVHIRDLKN